MADYIITVDPQDLKTASSNFLGIENDISTLTSDMIALISGISSWTGNASTAFVKQFNDLKKDMDKIKSMIDEHVKDLETMAGVYEKAEEANAAAAKALDTGVIS